jgi:hypothetical protein
MRGIRTHSLLPLVMSKLVLLCFLLLNRPSFCQETKSHPDSSTENLDDVPVFVDDYLERLSDTELRQICADRGFDIVAFKSGDEDTAVKTRKDLLEGARRCLSLEHDMNAILAEHPELAAELDKEIDRMKRQKELLEKEREEILVQKALLERQLEDAGVDIGPTQSPTHDKSTAVDKTPASLAVPDTLVGVLKESFRQLYERVMQDVRLVQKVLSPVTRHLDPLRKFIWKYVKPLLGEFYTKARQQLEQLQKPTKQQHERQSLPATNQ